ncbi:BTAD domain-containing putative transcriptional regulator [Streptomyces sp. NPDC102270]|uniref:AfsR/SARP family transcriptional regulator n=1 Tax=Streptomyces sp. NPDC102270 TaxID=3366150 RepID=UPI0037F2D79F
MIAYGVDNVSGNYVRILGPVGILAAGQAVPLVRRKQRLLLALLALESNRPVSFSRIVSILWPAHVPAGARNQVHVHICALRRALAAIAGGEECLETRNDGYVLNVPPVDVDAHRFERAVTDSERAWARGRQVEAHRILCAALDLWHGTPLEGLDGVFALSESARLQERRQMILERRLDLDLAMGKHAEALAELAALVAVDPLHQGFQRRRILALHCCERTAQALSACRGVRRLLVDELGIEAGEQINSLELALLRGVRAEELVAEAVGRV